MMCSKCGRKISYEEVVKRRGESPLRAIRCSHRLRHHVEEALRAGATKEEILEAVAVGIVMSSGDN